ncbi:FMN-binding negative transcriptional regulator [Algoriphagus marincola]|uniref:FMN-binding negative transcriptional regulator n=1 Tax=Algoriphagus marincola TaxID=264027 RepID=UPI00040F439D|nr:FMN-binding negative transcriptional regulator [Algoriphagus marincola]
MHVSKINEMPDKKEVLSFIKRFSFGTIISSTADKPIATHLPFSIIEENEKWILSSHFNKVNSHWRSIETCMNLIIFSEPHAYISPSNYVNHPSVPTWNYISVHTYGKGRILTAKTEIQSSIQRLINTYETPYLAQWNSFSDSFRDKMMNGVVAFEIEVTEIVASKKLSQNKSTEEQKNIITSLSQTQSNSANLIAEYMLNNLK